MRWLLVWLVICSFANKSYSQGPSPFLFPVRPGIKLSENVLVATNLSFNGAYDTNVLFSKDASRAESFFLNVIGRVDLEALSGMSRFAFETCPEFKFKTSVIASFRKYMDKDPEVSNQSGIELNAGGNFGWNISNAFATSAKIEYIRTLAARDNEAASAVAHDVFGTHAQLSLAPRGGRLLFYLDYQFTFASYENLHFAHNDNVFHDIGFQGVWKLFPKSDVFFSVVQGFVFYPMTTTTDYKNIDSRPFRAMVGYKGLVTSIFNITTSVGYANSFHLSGSSFNSIIANITGGLLIMPFAKISGGFEHGFSDSIFGNYYIDEGAFLTYSHRIINRLVATLNGEYRYRQYYEVPIAYMPDGSGKYLSHLMSLYTSLDYGLWRWIYIGVGYNFQLRSVPQDIEYLMEDVVGSNSYMRHVVAVRIGVSR